MAPPRKSNNSTVLRRTGRSSKQNATLTREQLEEDLAAFRKSGGKIEKLGNTNTFKKIG